MGGYDKFYIVRPPCETYCALASMVSPKAIFRVSKGKFGLKLEITSGSDSSNSDKHYLAEYVYLYSAKTGSTKFDKYHKNDPSQNWLVGDTTQIPSTRIPYGKPVMLKDTAHQSYMCLHI